MSCASQGGLRGLVGFEADELIVVVEDEAEAAANAVGGNGLVQDRHRELDGLAVARPCDDRADFAAVIGGDFFRTDVERDDKLGHGIWLVLRSCAGQQRVMSGLWQISLGGGQ